MARDVPGEAQRTPEQVLDVATGGLYTQVRTEQARLREQFLNPLTRGPLGQMQGQPATKQAINALFGDNYQSGQEVGDAIRALNGQGQRGAWAARQLVRAYIEGVFSSAHKVTGDQFVGARLANVLQANPQTAERLASTLNALPHGASIAPGFQRFLDIMAATGQRQRPGSMTSFNTEMMNEMKSNVGGVSGAIAGAGKHVVGAGFRWPTAVAKKFEQWSLGRNLDQLAELMVNPEAARRFKQLANVPVGGGRALAIATRLAILAGHRARRSYQLTDSSK